MTKMIQPRNVPDRLHRKLKSRAAVEGVSLSDYLLEETQRAADRPTLAELTERLQHRTKVARRSLLRPPSATSATGSDRSGCIGDPRSAVGYSGRVVRPVPAYCAG